MNKAPVTGSMLRDFVQCERRVHHDLHTPTSEKDEVSDFIQMLWENGSVHEHKVLSRLEGHVIDLREVAIPDRARETGRALKTEAQYILGARLEVDDRLGMPDVLERTESEWRAGDVKSGAALEKNGRPRLEYAVQVAHYASLLEAYRAGSGQTAVVIGRDGARAVYDLNAPFDRQGRSIKEITAQFTRCVRLIRDQSSFPRGATSASCKLCHWHTICEGELQAADDPTLIAGIGRALRDALDLHAPTIRALADLELGSVAKSGGRTHVPGLGVERLQRFQNRVRLRLTPDAKAYAFRPLGLSSGHREIHFDIETDPLRDNLVYLHGFLIREPVEEAFTEAYHSIFAETVDEEGPAFAAALAFLADNRDAHIYYYSKYERILFRALAARYPNVCSRQQIEDLFNPKRATDLLFDVIVPHTEWPTSNLSIKTLARHLGFDWRALDASGAASIAWFNEYLNHGDLSVKRRILAYNEDDVRASAVVLDGLRALPVSGPPVWPPTLD